MAPGVIERGGLWWLSLVVVVTATATAHAEPSTGAGLVWQAPPSCPDAAEVRARIERRLGMPIDRAVHGVEVKIVRDSGGREPRFVAQIDLRGITVANEVRVLNSARCDELTDAVAVVIARIAAEHRQPTANGRHELGWIEVRASPPSVPHVWGGGVRALGVSGIGVLPGVGVAGELAAYVRRRSLFVELAMVRWRPRPEVPYMSEPDRVDFGLDAVALRFGWGPEQLPLRGWVVAERGMIDGDAVVLDDGREGPARWAGGGGGFGVAWPMTPHTRLVGTVELVVQFQRPPFVFDGIRPGLASARCAFGLEIGWR